MADILKELKEKHNSFEGQLEYKSKLEQRVNDADIVIKSFPRLANGLTPDDVRRTPEWQAAKRLYDHSFNSLRAFNAIFVKKFAKELREARRITAQQTARAAINKAEGK